MDEEANRIANGSMRAQHVPLALQKVMGVTSFSNASLSVCTETGHIAYAAGSVVVVYVRYSVTYLLITQCILSSRITFS